MHEHALWVADGPYQLLPPLTEDEFQHLKADIGERGVLVAIEFDEDGNVLDGHHRLRACLELGISDYPRVVRVGWGEQEKRSHARALNTARRHLNREQRRLLIADELRENPSASNNSIAKRLGVSDGTVGSVREELGLDESVRLGADGKLYETAQDRALRRKPSYVTKLVFDGPEPLLEWQRFLRWLRSQEGEGTIAERVLRICQERSGAGSK